MHANPRSFAAFALLSGLAVTSSGCGAFAGDSSKDSPGPARDAAKAPPVSGTPDASEISETFGVFVAPAPAGRADGIGTRVRPVASVQAAIELGKQTGKRVYVCAGTFRESLVIADSISVIGGLDCSTDTWITGNGRSRIEATSSPAILAKAITSSTRLEALDVVAPNAAAPSASSIGLIAEHAPALVIAASRIAAGNAAKGEDGAHGAQLVQTGAPDGATIVADAECATGGCAKLFFPSNQWAKPEGGAGGASVCAGAAGHDGESGGAGGSGGLYEVYWSSVALKYLYRNYLGDAANGHENGQARTGATGAPGTNGANANAIGVIGSAGYAPANGASGGHGAPGSGGFGGAGAEPLHDPNASPTTGVWRGFGGAGGGAGGCPGLAGGEGKGGGASIAAVLVESALTLDGVELASGNGGDAGLGDLGSDPTPGGAAGLNSAVGAVPSASGGHGGNGGVAGVSGNGSAGPSIAVAHVGPPPVVRGATKMIAGTGGAGIAARSRTDGFGNVKTVGATPAGLSKTILPL